MQKNKLRIAFCTPCFKKGPEAFEVFSEGGSSFPSIGLLILASIARERGHQVFFKDFLNSARPLERAIEEIVNLEVDCLAISSNTDMIFQARELASGIKKLKPNMIILLGGPHVSSVPVETMKLCRDFDIGFVGEAEQSFSDFLDSDLSVDALRGIQGICFRQNGEIVLNERKPFIGDLDSLPFPAWDLIEDMRIYRPAVTNYRREPVFSLMTSRGCFGRCIFCDRGIFGNRVRMHSADYVIRMVRQLREQYGIREITFYDDNMVFDKKRLKEICALMTKEKQPLSWTCSARIDLVNEAMLRMLKDAGCWQISYGIESGSQKILDVINKNITVDKIKQTAGLMKKIGLSMRGYFIIGSPQETEESIKESLELILKLPMDDILVEYMTPYPGTELYNHIERYGTMLGDWASLNSYEMNFLPHGMSQELLKEHFFNFYKAFYLRPRIIINYARRIKNPLKITDLALRYFKFSRLHKD